MALSRGTCHPFLGSAGSFKLDAMKWGPSGARRLLACLRPERGVQPKPYLGCVHSTAAKHDPPFARLACGVGCHDVPWSRLDRGQGWRSRDPAVPVPRAHPALGAGEPAALGRKAVLSVVDVHFIIRAPDMTLAVVCNRATQCRRGTTHPKNGAELTLACIPSLAVLGKYCLRWAGRRGRP